MIKDKMNVKTANIALKSFIYEIVIIKVTRKFKIIK